MNRAQDAAQRQTFFSQDGQRKLNLAKLKDSNLFGWSVGVIIALFGALGMSFTPVEEDGSYPSPENDSIILNLGDTTSVIGGPRRSHWTTTATSGCSTTTTWHNKTDYARTVAQSMNAAYGTVEITAKSKGSDPVTASNGSQSYVDWDTGLGTTDQSSTSAGRDDLGPIHTNTFTFTATPTDPEEYYFVGWYSDAGGNTQVSTDNPWEDVEVKFPDQAGFTSYKDGSGVTTYEGSTRYTVTYYAKFAQIPAINVTFLAASTPARDNGYYTVAGKGVSETITTSNQTIGVKGITLTAYASEMAEFVRWYTEDGAGNRTTLSEENPCVTSFTAATKVGVEWRELTNHHKITFLSTDVDANGDPVGSYTVDAQTVNTSNYVYNTGDAYKYSPTLTATPASGYVFTGWYTKHGKKKDLLSTSNPWNPTFTQDSTIYAGFAYNNYTDDQKAQFKVGSTYYTDLNAANAAASSGSNKTIICTRDGILPPGNYTISSGVTLYIPYNTSETPITKPAVLETATALSAYRTLTFTEGANINVNGNICVGGQIMAGTGSTHTGGYPHGACGMIDMSKGGHIELNDGANLYAWGFVKGQDMDQGNNTINVGTVTANSGSSVWEDFSYGDFRGGSACGTIKGKESSWKFFPFQSYSIHNVEIPVTFKYGSADKNYTCLKTSLGTEEPGPFIIIGSSNSLFKLKDSKSTVRKWYDPTTDLMCYELSGTSQLDALEVEIYVSVNSANYNLPIASNMHIILADCDMTLSKPMLIQPGAVIEIKNGARATLSSNMYLFDVDNWGMYVYGAYFKPFKNLTSHKNRGDGSSKDLLDDAKLIVDGTLNVTGKLYSTADGANVMGNGGGKINFSTLPSATNIVMCTSTATNENVAVAYANLHNEDDSYTKSIASTTFHNVHGRWFTADDKDEKEDDHTYKFTYITSGAVSGTGGTSDWTPAVYSWDKKAALDLTQKWHNVTADACPNWWVGTDTYFYNWTESSDWHQFIPMKSAGMYSGSNNKIYTKTNCTWEELGETDENCLYTNGGVKKALVDGDLIELEPNTKDPAYHLASDENRYYICFSGCNWHEATKYENAEKAYVVDEDIFIWYDGAWMNAEWRDPFFYTLDETNVPIYYEYLNGEWVLSDPYIRVIDGLENRTYWFLDEAFAFASGSLRTSPTIKILRDMPNVSTSAAFKGTNKTCTLDLNGHIITSSCSNLLNINASGCVFTIVDNTAEKKGELRACPEGGNARTNGYTVTAGTLKLESGKMYSTNMTTRTGSTAATFTSATNTGVVVKANAVFTVTGGIVESVDEHQPYAVKVETNGTMNLSGTGVIKAHATKWYSTRGVSLENGKLNISGGSIQSTAIGASTVYGVVVGATASWNAAKSTSSSSYGILTMTGGEILARTPKDARGVQVSGAADVTGDYNESPIDQTVKIREYGRANISGGSIIAEATTSTTSYGVLSYGTTEISGGTITSTVQKSDQNTAHGVRVLGGTTTIKGNAYITANAPKIAYGLSCSGAVDGTRGWQHFGVLKVNGGTIIANTTSSTTAYGVYVSGTTSNLARTDSYKVFNGDYAAAGTAVITGGNFYANAKTTDAGGIKVDKTVVKNEASATPVCTINGGYYKASGTGSLYGCYSTVPEEDKTNFQIKGGYYSHNGGLATYAVSPKQVVTLLQTDPNRPDYEYKVAEAYTVTFKNGETQLQSGYQEVGKSPVYEGNAPTKASTTTASYVFDGWSATDGGALVSPLPALTSAGATYYAHFAETTLKYMATFDAKTNGGNEDAQVIYVEPAAGVGTLPTATKTGYTFNGWYTAASGGTKITSATVPTGDVTYFAQFAVNKYTLTWELEGGTVSTAGKYGSTSWPAKNATGAPSVAVPYGSALTAPAVTKTGYTFVNWGGAVAATMPAEALTYTAAWRANTNTKYTVKHYQQNVDGTYPTEPTETETLTGTTAVSVTPAVKSYEGFISPATQTKTIAADGKMVVEYQYRRIPYTIEWNAYTNGGTCATPSSTVLYGATLGSMPTAIKTGFRLDGWFTQAVGGVQITGTTPIMQNYGTLYAQFTEVPTYRVTFNANGHGTAPDAQDIVSGEKAAEPAAPSEKGYTFGGWYKEDACTNAWNFSNDVVTGKTILYAKWTAKQYTITFDSKGGSAVAAITQDYGTAVTAPANPSREGYTFNGWSPAVPETMPLNGITCVAQWTAKQYTITFDSNGGSAVESITQDYGTTVTAPANPTREGYTFSGWSPAVPATMPLNGTICVAQWTAKQYTITFDSNGGSAVESITQDYGTTVTAPANPTREGYTFNGWSPAVPATMPLNGTTCVAQWTAKQYTITFDSNGGSAVESITQDYGTTVTAPANPTREGYTFSGWSPAVPATMPLNGTKCVAQWNPISYTITYALDGGSATSANPESYTIESGDITLNKPSQNGYEFIGWTGSNGETPQDNVTITAGSTGNKSYTANWKKLVTITFMNYNNVSWSECWSQSFREGEAIIYGGEDPRRPSTLQDKFTFKGWVDEPITGVDGEVLALGTATQTKTFYAHYSREDMWYAIIWQNWNGVELDSNQRKYSNPIPDYKGDTPIRPTSKDGTMYRFIGWDDQTEAINAGKEVTFTAQYSTVSELVATEENPVTIDGNTTVDVTTVKVSGKLNVSAGTLTTTDLILEATPGTSGEITGEGNIDAANVYFDLTGPFKARTWYAVAVPWQVDVPAYDKTNCGVFFTNDGLSYAQQELGTTFDLIYYDGDLRAKQGHSDACWKYIEDIEGDKASKHIMQPGKAYMIYLASDANTIRFKKKAGASIHTNSLDVYTYSGNGKDANWNGIANPATFHAYLNAHANDNTYGENVGQVYDAETRSYKQFRMDENQLVAGQPIYVQVQEEKTVVANQTSYNENPASAPRRANAYTEMRRLEVTLASEDKAQTDRIIIRTMEDKEDTYTIGQDLVKMGASDIVPQMWVDRYDSRLCINTVAPVNDVATYPLSLFAPKADEYTVSTNATAEDNVTLYLTFDGRPIWNLTYSPYVTSLEKGTNRHYGLMLIRSKAPEVATGMGEVQDGTQPAAQKILLNGQVYILRGGELYSITGQSVK